MTFINGFISSSILHARAQPTHVYFSFHIFLFYCNYPPPFQPQLQSRQCKTTPQRLTVQCQRRHFCVCTFQPQMHDTLRRAANFPTGSMSARNTNKRLTITGARRPYIMGGSALIDPRGRNCGNSGSSPVARGSRGARGRGNILADLVLTWLGPLSRVHSHICVYVVCVC